ncbi:heterokaryon incompatibility protein-domain-containing protein [Dendryphion nanum]|uniref:Heterokaryon incompatibility protein-domain-containing protein n=1 Tax=Dendryphion nanum TaxID=256645 RepID=A0A9P9EEN7_9PLEO|nr:heterokaryon incompatibility protein-domain-containing protein [Dendryphion nanum]
MARCLLCNDQEKRNNADPCLAFDFTLEELAYSAYERSCDSCVLIFEGIRQFQAANWAYQRGIRHIYAKCRSVFKGKPETLSLDVCFFDDVPKLELELYTLQSYSWYSILPRPSPGSHIMSPYALNWVNSCLSLCKRTHEACRPTTLCYLPKRVLSLRDLGNGKCSIRLTEPRDEAAEYVALSHCWEESRACITTIENKASRRNDIAWSTMPKSFQNAVKFTLSLGLRYLWIDSLCIVQDDALDWEIESSRMGDVYQNAYLTLAAAASPGDPRGGHPDPSYAPGELELNLPEDVDSCRIAVRRPLKQWNESTRSHLIRRSPLLSRGWAFHERLLAPRILHFCESELVWECREMNDCECSGPSNILTPQGSYPRTQARNNSLYRQQGEHNSMDSDLVLALQLQRMEDVYEENLRVHGRNIESRVTPLEKNFWNLRSRAQTSDF